MSLAADRNTPERHDTVIVVPVAAGAKIHAGALVVANATGFGAPGSTALNLTYLGRAEEYVDNTGGADGAKSVHIGRRRSFRWANSSTDPVTQASLGKAAYIVDDQTVSATSGGGTQSAAGTVVGVDADGIWIE